MALSKEAFVTLATNDVYSKGARVLGQSLRNQGTSRELIVMITPQVSEPARTTLEKVFDHVILVDVLDSKDETHLALLKRPELGITFTKLHCWSLTDYSKCIFLDADTLVLTNIDELFQREELSAAPDCGWPDMFNSGVFVYRPCKETFSALINLAETEGSFDGGDQGLLNTYFSSWATSNIDRHLSFLYNMHSTATYTYSPAFAKFGKDTKVVHFIGLVKPWHHKYDRENDVLFQEDGKGVHEERFLRTWWQTYWQCEDLFYKEISFDADKPETSEMQKSKSEATEVEPLPDVVRFELWQRGNTDFRGMDRFEKIQAKIDQVLQSEPASSGLEKAKNGSNTYADVKVNVAVVDDSSLKLETIRDLKTPEEVKSREKVSTSEKDLIKGETAKETTAPIAEAPDKAASKKDATLGTSSPNEGGYPTVKIASDVVKVEKSSADKESGGTNVNVSIS